MLVVTGFGSSIVRELQRFVTHERITRMTPAMDFEAADRYLFAAGVLHQKNFSEQSEDELNQSIIVNLLEPVLNSEAALQRNPNTRVVLIGSESAYLGSFDASYVMTKRALHRYVERRAVRPGQFLGLISPPIIADSGMTTRRHDYPRVLSQRRHVFARDVAAVAFRMLYEDPPGRNIVERM